MLGECCELENGINKDEIEAFEYYKKLAEIEFKGDLKTLIQRCSDIGKYFDAYSGKFQYNFEEIVNDLELLEVNEVQ
ncbi:unnamed protein product [Rhizophagus irregularis]|nr:unnamed protein product [Rhizophagus irregularis]